MLYRHQVQDAVNRDSDRHTLASLRDEVYSNAWFAEHQMLHLIEISEIGLPDCYDSFKDFLYDFYSSVSWDKERDAQITLILEDRRFPDAVVGIMRKFGFDMREELGKALAHVDE